MNRLGFHLEPYVIVAHRPGEPRHEIGQVMIHRHMFLLMAPVKLSMKIGDGVNAVDGGVQMLCDLGRGVAGLQVQKARHDRQVVFDPMVEFVQQRGLVGLRTFERCDVYVEVREASG